MPRRTPGRTIDAEDNMRANLVRILEEQDRTIAWLERKVREAGYDLPVQAIWKAINKGRAIYVDEAIWIAHVLDVKVSDLVKP